MGIDIIIILIASIISIFIIEHYALKNPISGHKLAIFYYTFYNPITNKILFVILTYWLIRLLYKNEILYKNKFLLAIFFTGTYLLISGIIGISISTTLGLKDINSYLLSPYFNGVVWAIIIGSTLKSLSMIKSFIYTYVGFRLFEIGVTGLYLYFFQYENLLLASKLLKDYIRLDVDITKRLISFASRNANEAAFLLLGIGGFVFIKFYNKINFLNSISLIIFLSALFLTWTRSGWILFILLIISFFIILGKVKTKFFYNSFFLSFFVICFIAIMIINRNENESRMLSDETIMLRFELYFQYFNSLKLLPIFFGVFETIWVTCDRLFIEKYISSENIFLDTFVKYGLLGGCLFMACCFVFTYNYLYILGLAKKINQKLEPEDYHFVVILFCTFFFTLIMANTSLFEQTSFFWILFALSIPLRQVLVKSNHSYEHEI